jgi:DNA-binding CsgD family transcriptional regulator
LRLYPDFFAGFKRALTVQKNRAYGEIMYLQKVLAFSDFLAREPKSYNEIAQFLAMNTFAEEKSHCIYIGELIETGLVCTLGAFGWSSTEYSSFIDLPIQSAYPITESIRSNQVLLCKNDDAFSALYPLMSNFPLRNDWVSGIAVPAYPIGGIALFSSIDLELSDSAQIFYIAIGSLLGLYASRLPKALVAVAITVKEKIDLPQVPLSDRQLVIAGLLERGFNNAQIGLEIGYSESLIRQETVAIYQKLQVTGRKALQAIRTLNLEAESNLDLDKQS